MCASSLFALSTPARALDATFDNIVVSDGDNQTTLKKVDVSGANLTQPELAKLFAQATPMDERKALIARLKADKIQIPEAVLTNKTTRLTVSNLFVSEVTEGKAGHSGFSGIVGTGTSDDGSVTDIKAGTFALDGADVSGLFGVQGNLAFSHLSLDGLSITGADKDVPATAVGGNRFTLRVGGLAVDTTFTAGVLIKSSLALKQFAIVAPPASQLGQQLATAGYDKRELGLDYAAVYDPATQVFALDKLALSGAGAGALQIKATLAGIDKSLMSKNVLENIATAIAANVRNVEISFADAGVVDKAIGLAAAQQQTTPDALRAELAGMARQLIPVLIGNAPNALTIADSVSKFITVPSTMVVTMKPKTGSLGALDLMQIDGPAAFVDKVDLDIKIGAASAAAQLQAAPVEAPKAPPAKTAQAPAASAPAARKLSGLEAWTALVGNTIAGKNNDGDPFFEFYAKNGTVKQLDDDDVATGKWSVKGTQVCFEFPDDDEETCYKVAVDGKYATFTDEDGAGKRYEILAGNAKNL